jgi:PAS domain S-box-containing protein
MNHATLLLVEDDAILALHFREILERNGYRVAAVLARGEDVAPFLATTAVDLILMDIELKGAMTGIAAAAQVKHRVPVIFLTAFSQEPLLDQAKAVGPYGYLIKPVQERELVVTIGTALERCRLDRELREKTLALEKSEANYRTLFTEMLDGFALHEIIVSDDGEPSNYRFLAVNPAFERMTGLKGSEIVGRTVLEVLPATEPCWIATYARVALSGEPVHFEEYTAALGRYFESSNPTSPPRASARARAWDCPSSTASWPNTAASSPATVNWARGPPSGSSCRPSMAIRSLNLMLMNRRRRARSTFS